MLSAFPKHFTKGDFPSDNSPSRIFPNVQFSKGQVRPSEAPQATTGAKHCSYDGPVAERQNMLGGRALRLKQAWEVAVWEIAQFGSRHLGKYLWEVAAWVEINKGKFIIMH